MPIFKINWQKLKKNKPNVLWLQLRILKKKPRLPDCPNETNWFIVNLWAPFHNSFSAIKLDYPDLFGGIKWNGNQTLMDGYTVRGYWYYPVGIIWDEYRPYFPGPHNILDIAEVQLFIKKDCWGSKFCICNILSESTKYKFFLECSSIFVVIFFLTCLLTFCFVIYQLFFIYQILPINALLLRWMNKSSMLRTRAPFP